MVEILFLCGAGKRTVVSSIASVNCGVSGCGVIRRYKLVICLDGS
jgi:hypothetical protein